MPINILSPLKKKISIYSDFRKDLDINPLSNDIAIILDEESVKESIKNLILTDKGERLFRPNLGSDVRKSLFDLMTPATLQMLESNIRTTLKNYETRATIINVEVIPDYDRNNVQVNIMFYVQNSQAPITVSLFLERIR